MSTLSRRFFLKSLSACTASAAINAAPLPALAAGNPGGNSNILLVINLAGGMDTYAALQRNFGSLADRRPTLFRNMSDPNQILPLTGSLGVHASFSALKQQWDEGNVAIVNRVGYQNISRSHADAERAYARGVADRRSDVNSGWISRLGALYFPTTPFAVWDFSGGHETNLGPYRASTVRNLDSYGFDTDWQSGSNETNFRIDTLLSLIRDWPGVQGEQVRSRDSWDAVEQAIATIEGLPEVDGYPNNSLGRQFRDFDRTLFINDTKIGFIRTGGYDTHGDQPGRLSTLLDNLNESVSFFIQRMQTRGLWNRCTIYITSEFGRTLGENGNRGTDHGGAVDAIVISPMVRGGEYGPSYRDADFRDGHFLSPSVNVVDVLSDVVRQSGFDPGPIFSGISGSTGIFG